MGELARSSGRRAQPFLLSHCHSEDNWAHLPGTLCNPGWRGATHFMQAARWVRTQNCSKSLNLVLISNASKLTPSTSQSNPREDLKLRLPLVSDTVPFETEKGHWTQEGWEGPNGVLRQTLLRPLAYVGL